jgi:hypothetical protein
MPVKFCLLTTGTVPNLHRNQKTMSEDGFSIFYHKMLAHIYIFSLGNLCMLQQEMAKITWDILCPGISPVQGSRTKILN